MAALLAACGGPTAVDVPQVATPTAKSIPTPQATELRFALIGSVMGSNVWTLFDQGGHASYNDYAIRAGYWPRLYGLSVPDGQFKALAASGMPTAVEADGAFFAGTVPLRTDLKWSDGSPFTAEDVVFTINTAVGFQLGFDWQAFYDAAWIDHAEAVDAHTVRIYFKRAPSVAEWQYGVLQGPIVQKHYWLPKLATGMSLLPSAESRAQVDSLSAKAANLQQRVSALVANGVGASGEQAHQLQVELESQQGDLNQARNELAKAEAVLDTSMVAARQALYGLDGQAEPTLGTWMPAGHSKVMWTNTANPAQPFDRPAFQRVTYMLYADEETAMAAFSTGQVNAILQPPGVAGVPDAAGIAGAQIISNVDTSARFIAINPFRAELADPALRRALFCAINRLRLTQDLGVAALVSFVPGNGAWTNTAMAAACGEGYDPATQYDPSKAVEILKAAGYTWTTEPAGEQAGAGLQHPTGEPVGRVVLLAPSQQADPKGAAAAQSVEKAASQLGIPVVLQSVDPADIRFAVFNDHKYDLALVGWRLSVYPGYLCDWFGGGNPFGYGNARIRADCDALAGNSDLENARQRLSDIQEALAEDPSFIPLYSGVTYDLTRGIVYSFDHIVNGVSGSYGVPADARPKSP